MLRGVQFKMQRKILGRRANPWEPMWYLMETANSKLKELREMWDIETWDKTFLRYQFRWAGHVARYKGYGNTKWAYEALTHKDWQHHKDNVAKFGSQLHGKRVHVFRWEASFYKFWKKDDWKMWAADKTIWAELEEEWLHWRLHHAA